MKSKTYIKRDDLTAILSATARPEGGNHALLFGPRGTGKTTSSIKAALPNQTVISVTLNSEGSAAGLWGHFVPRGGAFEWNYGPAALAWIQGSLLVINELNHASEDVSNLLHVVLDNPQVASVTLPTGETIRPKEGFRAIATMNGRMDDVAPAILDRFTIKAPVLSPSSAMLNQLPRDLRATCEYLYSEAAKKESTSDWEPEFTYRQLQNMAELRGVKTLSDNERAELVTGSVKAADKLIDAVMAFSQLTPAVDQALA